MQILLFACLKLSYISLAFCRYLIIPFVVLLLLTSYPHHLTTLYVPYIPAITIQLLSHLLRHTLPSLWVFSHTVLSKHSVLFLRTVPNSLHPPAISLESSLSFRLRVNQSPSNPQCRLDVSRCGPLASCTLVLSSIVNDCSLVSVLPPPAT